MEIAVPVLAEKVAGLERDEESINRRIEAHIEDDEQRDREVAKILQAIQLDIHEIRAGKKSLVQAVRIGLVVLGLTGAGMVAGVRWVAIHWLHDMQLVNDTSYERKIP